MNFLIFFLLLFSSPAYSSDFSVSAEVDRHKVALNESFTFSVKIKYKKTRPDIRIPDLSSLSDFNVSSQWSGTQTSMSMVNGKTNWTSTYSQHYTLQAKTKGRLRIDSLRINVNGKNFTTNPLFIEVTRATRQPQNPSGSSNLFSSPSSRFLDPLLKLDPFNIQPSVPSGKAFKFKMNLNKKLAYVGEMIKADWELWISLGSAQHKDHEMPELKGFWREELAQRGKFKFIGTQVEDTILYRKTLIDSQALFPVKSGVLTIDPYTIKVLSPSGFQWREELKKTKSRRIIVKPLPAEGRGNFSGGVGSFKVTASLNQTHTKVYQPISFRLRFEGQGHPRLIQMPPLSLPEGLKSYSATHKSKFSFKKSYKEFETLIVPQKVGMFALPSFVVTTFNPSLKKYVKHKIPPFTFQVAPNLSDTARDQISFFDESQEVDSATDKIAFWDFIKEKWNAYIKSKDLLKFWIVFYSVLFFIVILIYFIPTRNKIKAILKRKVNHKLKEIKVQMKKNEKSAPVLLTNLVYFVLSELNPDHSSQEWHKLLENLPPSLYHNYAEEIKKLMQELETLGFTPANSNAKSRKIQAIFEDLSKLITKMIEKV